jgi:hypothetical protein
MVCCATFRLRQCFQQPLAARSGTPQLPAFYRACNVLMLNMLQKADFRGLKDNLLQRKR